MISSEKFLISKNSQTEIAKPLFKMGRLAAQNVTWAGASQNSYETQLLSKLGGEGPICMTANIGFSIRGHVDFH